MTYSPDPVDTSGIAVPEEIIQLTELLAQHNHNVWAFQRIRDGWQYGPQRDDKLKLHPGLIPYEYLPDSEKNKNIDEETLGMLAPTYKDQSFTASSDAKKRKSLKQPSVLKNL